MSTCVASKRPGGASSASDCVWVLVTAGLNLSELHLDVDTGVYRRAHRSVTTRTLFASEYVPFLAKERLFVIDLLLHLGCLFYYGRPCCNVACGMLDSHATKRRVPVVNRGCVPFTSNPIVSRRSAMLHVHVTRISACGVRRGVSNTNCPFSRVDVCQTRSQR
jgi:hypothetical protein